MSLVETMTQAPVRVPGEFETVAIPFTFTTAANGDPTLAYDYGGELTVTRNTAAYTFTIGRYHRFLGASVSNGGSALNQVAGNFTASATNGTVTLTYGAAVASQTVSGVLYVAVRRQ